jgi:Fic family protein
MYLHEQANWTAFGYDRECLSPIISSLRFAQGKLLGQMQALGFSPQTEAALETFSLDVLKSSEIEGEKFNPSQVRSSIARRLGIKSGGLIASNPHVDGVVEMVLDATQNHALPISKERLSTWHAKLFPTGKSGLYSIDTGSYRQSRMQVVSGGIGGEKIHYEAPAPERVPREMAVFLRWLNGEFNDDLLIKAAIAHLWFVTIHPFDDGNGRIARALTDYLLAQGDNLELRFYSMSNQIMRERDQYYRILAATQRSDGKDITPYLRWFLECLQRAVDHSQKMLEKILEKTRFWQENQETALNSRQKKMINLLFDHFEGNLSSGKWAKICKCSVDSALNDINDLIGKKILRKAKPGGRSTHYIFVKDNFRSSRSS